MPNIQSSELDTADKLALLAVYRLSSGSCYTWFTTVPIACKVGELIYWGNFRTAISENRLTGVVSRSLNKLCTLGLLEKSWRRMRRNRTVRASRRRRGYTLNSATAIALCREIAMQLERQQPDSDASFELVDKFTLYALNTINARGDHWYDIVVIYNEVERLGRQAQEHYSTAAVRTSLNKLANVHIVKKRCNSTIEDTELYKLNEIEAVEQLLYALHMEWREFRCFSGANARAEQLYREVARTCTLCYEAALGNQTTTRNVEVTEQQPDSTTRLEAVDKFTIYALNTVNARDHIWHSVTSICSEVQRLASLANLYYSCSDIQASLNKLVLEHIVKQRHTTVQNVQLYVLSSTTMVEELIFALYMEWQATQCFGNTNAQVEHCYRYTVRACAAHHTRTLTDEARITIANEDRRRQASGSLNTAYEQKREKALSELEL